MPTDDVKKSMTEEEVNAQMELTKGEGRDLLTEEEQSSRYNISHNSDNGYLYQDADFLCGAIIKARASEDRKKKLLEKHQWSDSDHVHGLRYCPECAQPITHAPDCAIAAELAGIGGK